MTTRLNGVFRIPGEIEDRLYARDGERCEVLFACESGSRAWGFASPDSDFDVRFVYAHPLEWYLSVRDRDDHLEFSMVIDGVTYDCSGWDVRKALRLLGASNPSLIDWLSSGVVYHEDRTLVEGMKQVMKKSWNPVALVRHSLSLASHNWKDYLKVLEGRGEEVSYKKYLYVMRGLLNAMYVVGKNGEELPWISFERTVEALWSSCDISRDVRDAVMDLVVKKRRIQEWFVGPRISVLDEFIERNLDRYMKDPLEGLVKRRSCMEDLDGLFRYAVKMR